MYLKTVDTKKLVPLTSFVDIKGVLEYFEEKADEIKSGANRYWALLEVVRKSKAICQQG